MSDTPLIIAVIHGTAREQNRSIHAARFVMAELKKHGVGVKFVEPADYIIGRTEDNPEKDPRLLLWQKIAASADAFVIVTPEYNRGYPGELKMLLDALYDEYEKKPVGLIGVSNGGFGGASVVTNILPVLKELGMVIIRETIRISKIQDVFDEEGRLKDEKYIQRFDDFFDELLWFASLLKKRELTDPHETS